MTEREPEPKKYPALILYLIVAASAWFTINTAIVVWNMALSVWVANVQSPQAVQQLQQKNAEIQRQLDAERAKAKPGVAVEEKK